MRGSLMKAGMTSIQAATSQRGSGGPPRQPIAPSRHQPVGVHALKPHGIIPSLLAVPRVFAVRDEKREGYGFLYF